MAQDEEDAERRKKTPAPDVSASEEDEDAEARGDTDDNTEELAQSDEFAQEMKALEEAGEATDEPGRQYLITRFWQAARGFWGKRGRRIAWILSGALLIIILLNIAASYGMNLW